MEEETRTEEVKITCPICEKDFQDMRGLTSHARHSHNFDKKELNKLLHEDEKNDNFWNLLGGIGIGLLTLITLGRLK